MIKIFCDKCQKELHKTEMRSRFRHGTTVRSIPIHVLIEVEIDEFMLCNGCFLDIAEAAIERAKIVLGEERIKKR